MSGLEIIGAVFGACGFIGQVIHYSRKYRERKKARLITTNSVITTQTSGSNGQVTRVRRSSQSQVAIQLDHGRTIREQWSHFSDIQRDNNEVVRAGIRAIERSHDNHHRANEVAWETVRAMNAVYVEENRRFTYTTLVMASLITFLAFFLGVYTGENSILKQLHYPTSWDFPAFQAEDGGDLQHSAVAIAKGAVIGYTFVPIQLPWFTCKAMFNGLVAALTNLFGPSSSHLSTVSEIFSMPVADAAKSATESGAAFFNMFVKSALPKGFTEVVAITASTLYSALDGVTWLWCYPWNFAFDLLAGALEYCLIPKTITISVLGGVGIAILLMFCLAILISVQDCKGKGDLGIELWVLSLSTPFCVICFRWLSELCGLSAMAAGALVAFPYGVMLVASRWCPTCYLICLHESQK